MSNSYHQVAFAEDQGRSNTRCPCEPAETLGAIVGGVVGGVALLCIVVVVMVIIRSRKKKASPPTTAAAETVKPQMVAIDSIPMGTPVA